MKTQVARQFSLMVKQIKLSGERGGGAGERAAAERAELSRATSSDLAQTGSPERVMTNPGLSEDRLGALPGDARTSDGSSEARTSSETRSSRTTIVDDRASRNSAARSSAAQSSFAQAAADAAAAGVPPGVARGEGEGGDVGRAAEGGDAAVMRLLREEAARPAVAPLPGASTREKALARSRAASAASTTSARRSSGAGPSSPVRSSEMRRRMKSVVGAGSSGELQRHPSSGELQLAKLPLQRAVGCRAAAPAATASHHDIGHHLKAAGAAVVAGNRMQRLGAHRAPPPEGWPAMEGVPAGDDKAARESAHSWLTKLEDNLLGA